MSSSQNRRRFSLPQKVRAILHPKPTTTTATTAAPPISISHPTRLSARPKRSYREVDVNESDSSSSDLGSGSSSAAASRGARVRQRTDSTSSVETIRPFSQSFDLDRTSSQSLDGTEKGFKPTPSRPSPNTVHLNPGRAGPARAALTRTTSHNRVGGSEDLPKSTLKLKDGQISFPSSKPSTSTTVTDSKASGSGSGSSSKVEFPTKQKKAKPLTRESSSMMSVVSTLDDDDDEERAVRTMPKSSSGTMTTRPLSRTSSSMMSIASTLDEPNTSRGTGMPKPKSSSTTGRALSRTSTSSSMMSIVSDSGNSGPSRPTSTVSRISAAGSTSPSKLPHPSELADSELAIDRALAEEIWEAEHGGRDSGFGDMLSSVSEARSDRKRERRLTGKSTATTTASHKALSVARTFEMACREDPSLMEGWRRGRFDVRVQPLERHVTVWDVKNTDVLTWKGTILIQDTLLSSRTRTTSSSRLHYYYTHPPIEDLQIVFFSIEDPPSGALQPITVTPPSSPGTITTTSQRTLYKPEFLITYTGNVLPHHDQVKLSTTAKGIAIRESFSFGSYVPESSSSSSSPSSEGRHTDRDTDRPSPAYALDFFVPIPMSLFARHEYRRFRTKTRVTFGTSHARASLVEHSGVVDVAVEHLRKETHMDGKKPLWQLSTPPPSSP